MQFIITKKVSGSDTVEFGLQKHLEKIVAFSDHVYGEGFNSFCISEVEKEWYEKEKVAYLKYLEQ